MGYLNSFSASGGGNLNKNFPKIQMPGGLPGGGMYWYIMSVEMSYDGWITTLRICWKKKKEKRLAVATASLRLFFARSRYLDFFFCIGVIQRFNLPLGGTKNPEDHSRPQRPRSFLWAPRIATSGQVQRHSGFEWLCKHNRLRPEPIRFVILDSKYAQSDVESVNRGLPVLD